MKPLFETDVNHYTWVNFYKEFATQLLKYKNDRKKLVAKIKKVFENIGMKLPTLDKNNLFIDIDPFTIFGTFNKGITYDNRVLIINSYAKEFNIESKIPDNFDGIPVLNNLSATFYRFVDEREETDIDNLWNLFEAAIKYADKNQSEFEEKFTYCFDIVRKQKGIKWNITMGLYWIRPNIYMNLDSRNRWFISLEGKMPREYIDSVGKIKFVPSGSEYLKLLSFTQKALKNENYKYKNFIELSYYAWLISEEDNERIKNEKAKNIIEDKSENLLHYWIYSPGDNASMWDEFSKNGIMGIGWDDIGRNLKEFATKQDIKEYMKIIYDAKYSYTNDAHCLWQFANEIKVGDIIFAKKGMHTIIGKGVVVSEYIFDAERKSYQHIRKVDWQNVGEWEHPGQAAMKTLTNITADKEYVQKLLSLFAENEAEEAQRETEVKYPAYTKEDFLDEVYMDEADYNTLVELLDTKYNIILQGAPGVGKTFAAKRLAYSIMGEKDTSRVAMVQFHQSYSYEDFIQGYRPADNGFKLETGSFYKFCKAAEIDDERLYFFIIDEINRGFGELMMLIENDKRGEKAKLLYKDEWFSVPKNVRIIGMMNTADRSLAMMDYALRRRFAFYDFSPAFADETFRRYVANKNNDKLENLIKAVENLNNAISSDESLGDGFRIGHSYFCMEKEITDAWLKSIVEYEIIPTLKEYWFDEPGKVRDWSANLRSAIK